MVFIMVKISLLFAPNSVFSEIKLAIHTYMNKIG